MFHLTPASEAVIAGVMKEMTPMERAQFDAFSDREKDVFLILSSTPVAMLDTLVTFGKLCELVTQDTVPNFETASLTDMIKSVDFAIQRIGPVFNTLSRDDLETLIATFQGVQRNRDFTEGFAVAAAQEDADVTFGTDAKSAYFDLTVSPDLAATLRAKGVQLLDEAAA